MPVTQDLKSIKNCAFFLRRGSQTGSLNPRSNVNDNVRVSDAAGSQANRFIVFSQFQLSFFSLCCEGSPSACGLERSLFVSSCSVPQPPPNAIRSVK